MVQYFVVFLVFSFSGGSLGTTTSPQQQNTAKLKDLCEVWNNYSVLADNYLWVLGSGWKRKSHKKGLHRSLYWHNKNASFDSSIVVKSVFQNWPQKVGLTDCSDVPSFRQFISQFLNNRRVSIDAFVMSIELRAELSFLALFMKASSKMRCGEIELCFKKQFFFCTIKHLNMSLVFKIFLVLKIYR